MIIKRRDFICRAAASGAVLTLPGFLTGCGVQQATTMADPIPENPFLDWFGVDEATTLRVMSELTANGADAADLYFQHTRNNSLALEGGVISDAKTDIQQGVGLRVVIGEQTGYAFTEDLTLPSMLAAARAASAVAAGSKVAAPQAFASKEMGDMYSTKLPWADVGVNQKMPILKSVEDKARSLEPSVEKVSVYWADSDERVMIAALDGSLVTDRRPMTRLTVLVTAKKGEEVQSGYSNIAAREEISWYTEERLSEMVQEAVDRTMVLFDARRVAAGEMPVILASGASGIMLHEAIGHAMEADFNRQGESIYADMIGEKVAEQFVTVVDQASIPGERGALNYDDEGVKAGRTVMVEDGVLKSYLHDRISAKQYGLTPTGSGRRESYKFMPMPRMSCTFMENGPHAREEVIEAVDRGIICETYTNGQVQIGAGDFTFHVKNGWLVEGGKVTAPVKDVRITGNGPELLKRITMVADDARLDTGGWTCGKNGQSVPVSQGIPTVLVPSMSVGT
ncbi:MAG: TldD/PmbA family protein [Gammaproteobacteria bacterium]|nr:TldD/PmbA family protein [Gammaproteobacteria bacterium]MDH3415203.1 TldD/PmbA family protein [Gammaproteobacteria bacterium]